MVRGIEKFRAAFAEFAGNYVVIGGTACERHEENAGLTPRATKDIDMILIVEALSHDFVARFWDFIKEGQYTEKQLGETANPTKHQYYRFRQPSNPSFPAQIELFSRSLGVFSIPKGVNVTPIPTDSDLSSLSAILMDDDYYNYTIDHSEIMDGIHIAKIESLIALKCKAYLQMKGIRDSGGHAESKHIKKHRNDVFRMVSALPSGESVFAVPENIFSDVQSFCKLASNDLPDSNFVKDMGLAGISPQQILEKLENSFRGETGEIGNYPLK